MKQNLLNQDTINTFKKNLDNLNFEVSQPTFMYVQ